MMPRALDFAVAMPEAGDIRLVSGAQRAVPSARDSEAGPVTHAPDRSIKPTLRRKSVYPARSDFQTPYIGDGRPSSAPHPSAATSRARASGRGRPIASASQ